MSPAGSENKDAAQGAFRAIAWIALVAAFLVFAPLAQGVGLSAGEGTLISEDVTETMHDLASSEVNRFVSSL